MSNNSPRKPYPVHYAPRELYFLQIPELFSSRNELGAFAQPRLFSKDTKGIQKLLPDRIIKSLNERPAKQRRIETDNKSDTNFNANSQFTISSSSDANPNITSLILSCHSDVYDYIEYKIFARLDQTNLTNPSDYCTLLFGIDIDNNTMDIQPGINFLAYCNNLNFHDKIAAVVIPKGYYTDSNCQFTVNEELWELICPKCKQPISGNNLQGIGFSQCCVRIKYRLVDGVNDEIALKASNNEFSFAKLSPPGNVRYFYVKFQMIENYNDG